MKGKVLLIVLLIVFVLLVVGTVFNVKDYLEGPDYNLEEETIRRVALSNEHCVEDICINNMYVEKTTDSLEGTEYYLDFDIENKGKKDLNNIEFDFIFKKEKGEAEIKPAEKLSLESGVPTSYNFDSIEQELDDVLDYSFTYTTDN